MGTAMPPVRFKFLNVKFLPSIALFIGFLCQNINAAGKCDQKKNVNIFVFLWPNSNFVLFLILFEKIYVIAFENYYKRTKKNCAQ